MKLERRIFDLTDVRTSDGDGPKTIEGYAAMFNRDSLDLGGFIEQIAPGAFKRSLVAARENPVTDMIHAFWGHDDKQPLASTRSGKLVLVEDEKGLRFRFPASRLTPQQLDAIQDGDMRMSFGFYVSKEGQQWTRGEVGQPDRRRILDATLMEISPVAKPAYPSTQVSARDVESARAEYEKWKKQQPEPKAEEPSSIQQYHDRAAAIGADI